MAVVNLTPDSFSDGGRFIDEKFFSKTLLDYEKMGVHIVDLGTESTRPGAKALAPDEELTRLKPFLERTFRLYGKKNDQTLCQS